MSKHRSINQVLDLYAGTNLTGAEIGVFKGHTSIGLLANPKIKHLYLIDPWQSGYSINNGKKKDSSDRSQKQMDSLYNSVLKLAKRFPNRTTIIREPSIKASIYVPNELDFVFIDGDHSFKAVSLDLTTWIPKVKQGGLVFGDDWSTGWKSVIKAVTLYIKDHDPFLPPEMRRIAGGRPVPYEAPIINRTSQTVWWGIRKSSQVPSQKP